MIETSRKKLEKIDEKIIKLLSERYQITTKIGEHKKRNNIKTIDKKREKELTDKYLKIAEENNLPKKELKEIFIAIFNFSYHSQK